MSSRAANKYLLAGRETGVCSNIGRLETTITMMMSYRRSDHFYIGGAIPSIYMHRRQYLYIPCPEITT